MTVAASISAPPHQHTAALRAVLRGCSNPGVGRRALLVRIADLPWDLGRPHHLRLIEAALEPLLGLDRAELFRLADGTLVLIWRGPAGTEVQHAVQALRTLLADVPICPIELLELPRDAAALARIIAISAEERPSLAPSLPGRPLDLASLAQMETALAQADVTPMLRRKPVCTWPVDGGPQLQWDRCCLSARRVAAALAPGLDLRAEPWLFRRLTRSFDRRVLSGLSDPATLRAAVPFALDLNVASMLGPEFLRLDAALGPALREHVILGVHAPDILADPAAYVFARNFVRARGYRLMLRRVSLGWLRVFLPDQLGVDLIQLRAPPVSDPTQPLPATLAAAAVVLCGVDRESTLDWARQQGIGLFEGPWVERQSPAPVAPLPSRARS